MLQTWVSSHDFMKHFSFFFRHIVERRHWLHLEINEPDYWRSMSRQFVLAPEFSGSKVQNFSESWLISQMHQQREPELPRGKQCGEWTGLANLVPAIPKKRTVKHLEGLLCTGQRPPFKRLSNWELA